MRLPALEADKTSNIDYELADARAESVFLLSGLTKPCTYSVQFFWGGGLGQLRNLWKLTPSPANLRRSATSGEGGCFLGAFGKGLDSQSVGRLNSCSAYDGQLG